MSRIKKVVAGYYSDETQAAVKYAVSLTDGRMLMLSVPMNMAISEREAMDIAKPQAEAWMADVFTREHNEKRFVCCDGMTHYGIKGHKPNCPAFTDGGPVAI